MRSTLEAITAVRYFPVSKQRYPDGLPPSLINGAIEQPDYWQLPCSHLLHPGVSEEEIKAQTRGINVSRQLSTLLGICNGAELFRLYYQPAGYEPYWNGRFNLMSLSDLRQINKQILETFRSYAGSDSEVMHIRELNYLAFCDVGDGNFLATVLNGPAEMNVFFLDHEYGFYPFGARGTESAYEVVASSIEGWLEILLKTRGEGGAGSNFIPL